MKTRLFLISTLLLILILSCNEDDTSPLVINYKITPISYLGTSDGKIDLTVTGGTEPYRYDWSNGKSSEDIYCDTLGEFTVTITDSKGQLVVEHIILDDKYLLYKKPFKENDGWNISDIEDLSINSDTLLYCLRDLYNDHKKIHSVLLAIDGKLVLEEYYSGYDSYKRFIEFDRHTLHEVQSASKTYRSMLVGIAIKNGKVSFFFPSN